MEIITEKIAQPVPAWLQVRYGQLWEKFSHTEFTLEQATELLKENKSVVNVILSRLRQSGWISVCFDKDDFRKRKYHLIEPSLIFKKIKVKDKDEKNNTD